jgi:hypothetical protein
MKTKETDILMICKGHFNQDKFETTYDALKAYQCEYTGCPIEYMPDSAIFHYICDTAEAFFKPRFWRLLIDGMDGITHDIDMAKTGLLPTIYPDKEIKLTYRYLIDKIGSELCMLQVRDDNEWIIDLSDYEEGEKVI